MEESGELARALHHKSPHTEGDVIEDTTEEEFWDVLYYLCASASLYDEDIEKWMSVEEREADVRCQTNCFDFFMMMCCNVPALIFTENT